MTIRLLPHYFKKIGLTLYILGALPDFIRGFVDAFSGVYDYNGNRDLYGPAGSVFYLTDQKLWLLGLISYTGIALYALAKDRVHDELFQRLRLEAIELAFFLTVLVLMVIYLFSGEFRISASYLINLQLIAFLVIYFIKKQSITSH